MSDGMKDQFRRTQIIGYCDTHGKALFTSRKLARRFLRRLPNRDGIREYRCTEVDGMWHCGHLPQSVRSGRCTADEIYGGG